LGAKRADQTQNNTCTQYNASSHDTSSYEKGYNYNNCALSAHHNAINPQNPNHKLYLICLYYISHLLDKPNSLKWRDAEGSSMAIAILFEVIAINHKQKHIRKARTRFTYSIYERKKLFKPIMLTQQLLEILYRK